MLPIKKYSYNNITFNVIDKCVKDVDYMFHSNFINPTTVSDSGAVHQTPNLLFDEKMPLWNENWKILRDTFLQSINQYIGLDFSSCKAWVYADFPSKPQPRGHQWHSHPYSLFSGVLYLTLPKDYNNEPCFTTEFKEENGGTSFLEPAIGSWFIFDSRRVHRPGYWKFHEMEHNRYCLAASVK